MGISSDGKEHGKDGKENSKDGGWDRPYVSLHELPELPDKEKIFVF